MQGKVLLVTGGLITSDEKSLSETARKWLAQWSATESAWLDLKVKLTIAEPRLAMKLEEVLLPLRPRQMRETVRACLAANENSETPSLTEVLLATLLERAGVPYERLTVSALFIRAARVERLLRETECVFLSTTYLHDLSELECVVQRVKRPHNRIVAGGALLGVIAGQWEGMPAIDVAAVGYGELLTESLVGWIRSRYTTLEAPSGGRLLRKKHTAFLHSGVPATEDLDFLPAPDWGLAERDHGKRFRMIYYESVRGCPYRCNFCNYPFLFDDTRFRYKSAEKMADDWERYASALGVEYITCLDSLFTVPRPRLKRFCRLLIERKIKVRWICYARADDLADEGTVILMKQAGAHQVQIGIESGDPALLRNMNKACSVEANWRALENCRKHGLTSAASLIVGFPGETEETIERTYRFLETSPPDFYFLATFSTRVTGVPLLRPENRERFGLRLVNNLHSMAPYWTHDTMSCADVTRHVRALDRRIMRNRVTLNATLFYPGMLSFASERRKAMLEFQKRVAVNHSVLTRAFDWVQRWAEWKLHRDIEAHFPDRKSETAVAA